MTRQKSRKTHEIERRIFFWRRWNGTMAGTLNWQTGNRIIY